MHVRRTDPEAYLLTWSAYGSWLPGDERGSVDDSHNGFGTPPASPDPERERMAAEAMRHAAVHFDGPMRDVIEGTVQDHCRIRTWGLLAINVRTNHVHAVVDCGVADPDVAMEQFKAWCTRRLRGAKLIEAERPVWTRRGSTRYCWDAEDVIEAVDYVVRRQGEDLHGKP